jgi:hypothetical protein
MKLWDVYDTGILFVIRAETERRARQMAEKNSDESGEKILAKDFECVEITIDGIEEIIVSSDDRCGY